MPFRISRTSGLLGWRNAAQSESLLAAWSGGPRIYSPNRGFKSLLAHYRIRPNAWSAMAWPIR